MELYKNLVFILFLISPIFGCLSNNDCIHGTCDLDINQEYTCHCKLEYCGEICQYKAKSRDMTILLGFIGGLFSGPNFYLGYFHKAIIECIIVCSSLTSIIFFSIFIQKLKIKYRNDYSEKTQLLNKNEKFGRIVNGIIIFLKTLMIIQVMCCLFFWIIAISFSISLNTIDSRGCQLI